MEGIFSNKIFSWEDKLFLANLWRGGVLHGEPNDQIIRRVEGGVLQMHFPVI